MFKSSGFAAKIGQKTTQHVKQNSMSKFLGSEGAEGGMVQSESQPVLGSERGAFSMKNLQKAIMTPSNQVQSQNMQEKQDVEEYKEEIGVGEEQKNEEVRGEVVGVDEEVVQDES